MRVFLVIICLFLSACVTEMSYAEAILLSKKDATVWLPAQVINGKLQGFDASEVTVHHNKAEFKLAVANNGSFTINLKFNSADNKIWVTALKNGKLIISDTLNLTLGYQPVAIVKPFAVIKGNKAILKYQIINNPNNADLKYSWSAEAQNPASSFITNNKNLAEVEVPKKNGIYYYVLTVKDGAYSIRYKTYVKRDNEKLYAFNMDIDNVTWLNNAIIYEITPNTFVAKASFDNITQKLPEIKSLGINTIWLQPVYKTQHGGQGYDVIDYLGVRDDLGSEEQLGNLISEAKKIGLKVMFDFVPNHTSIHHPYAVDLIKNGTDSHYYNYYQHKNDGVAYSSNYQIDKQGFVSYFWENLVNLDYNNTEVQQWIMEVCKYWITKYDIDGYRFDAVWGMNARTPEFSKKLRTELKSLKPDFLLLAEDKGTIKEIYDQGFDAGYDWTPDTSWVSQWSWQTDHDLKKNRTIFNYPDTLKRAEMLREALFNNNNYGYKTLRFIENNDIPRFIAAHTIQQTKTAAALMFAIPGIPMLYNGQEIGSAAHPYSSKAVFSADKSIASADENGLFSHYKKLIKLRAQYPALRSLLIKEAPVLNSKSVLAFHKWQGKQHFIIVVNLNQAKVNALVDLNNAGASILTKSIQFNEVLAENAFDCRRTDKINILEIPIEGNGIRWLLVGEKIN